MIAYLRAGGTLVVVLEHYFTAENELKGTQLCHLYYLSNIDTEWLDEYLGEGTPLPKLNVDFIDGGETLVVEESDLATKRFPAGPLRLDTQQTNFYHRVYVNFQGTENIFNWVYLGKLCETHSQVSEDET